MQENMDCKQRRRRTYIVAYRQDTGIARKILSSDPDIWMTEDGTIASEFPVQSVPLSINEFDLEKDIRDVSANFNADKKNALSPFFNTGLMWNNHVRTLKTVPSYVGPVVTLGDLLLKEEEVPNDFFITETDLKQWKYLKGAKHEPRVTKDGYEYMYNEGGMAFPDSLDAPSRTIITGEGGKAPSRFKHVVEQTPGNFRRLTPIELERLDGFPDNHTAGASDIKRAFLMGNALVVQVVEKIGKGLLKQIKLHEQSVR